MAYIQKRVLPSGKIRYRVRIQIQGTPEVSKSFPTIKEARKWSVRMEAEIRAGRYFGREEGKERTFGEFIDLYIEKVLPKNPKSQQKLTTQLLWWKKHLNKYFLCHISPSMIAQLKENLLEEVTFKGGLRSKSTANRYLAALSKAFSICIQEWGWIDDNPVKKVSRFKENKARDRYLTKEEITRLLDECKKSKSPHLYPVTLFALCTGARKGEILGLKWKDIDFDKSVGIFRNTKNGETRTVPLTKHLLECIKNEKRKRDVCSEYVFPNHDGKKLACIRSAWENVVKRAGLNDVCFHLLRHTAASHLVSGGASLFETAVLLGHRSLASTKVYAHLSISATKNIVTKMNDEILEGK